MILMDSPKFTSDFDSIVDEIERGSSVLIDDYNKVIDEVEFPASIKTTLKKQRSIIEDELKVLVKLKDEYLLATS